MRIQDAQDQFDDNLFYGDGGMTSLAVSPNSLHNPNPKNMLWNSPPMLALTTPGMRNGRD
jgi:hypothetical protein